MWRDISSAPRGNVIGKFRMMVRQRLKKIYIKVSRPIPPAWSSKPRTYGAYKRMVIRRIGV